MKEFLKTQLLVHLIGSIVVAIGCSKSDSENQSVGTASDTTLLGSTSVDDLNPTDSAERDVESDLDVNTASPAQDDGESTEDVDVDSNADAEDSEEVSAGSEGDSDSDSDTDTDTDMDSDTDSYTTGEIEGNTDSSSGANTDESHTEAGTDTGISPTSDSDSGVDSEAGSDTEIVFYYDTETDNEPAQVIVIDSATKHQLMEGFGASDAWNADFVGKFWTEEQKEAIARLLFSAELNDDGSVTGIGLSRWRFNVGGGSAEQGVASGIEEDTRRAECFLNADGSYDWSKQSGQQWFLNKAHDYGVEKFVLFSNSPPVHYTKNGLAFCDDGNSSNLAADRFGDFADFLTTVLQHFEEEGISFEEVSPVNEPQWDWTEGQEGSNWSNDDIAGLVGALNAELVTRGLSTHIMIPDSGHYSELYENTGNPDKSDYMWNFFDSSRPNDVGDLERVPAAICSHSYWTFDNDNQLADVRTEVRTEAEWSGLKVQQTEYSMLSIPEELGDDPSHFDIALFMGKVIYADLAIAHTVSWSFWTSLDRERWGHKNRFLLIQVIPPRAPDAPLTEGGTHAPHKTLWVLGNYSLFIRPGYQRVALTGADNLAGLMGTAYVSPNNSEYVAVFVNMTRAEQKVALQYDNLPEGKTVNRTEVYVTTESDDLTRAATLPPNISYKIPPRSVVTMKTILEDG